MKQSKEKDKLTTKHEKQKTDLQKEVAGVRFPIALPTNKINYNYD